MLGQTLWNSQCLTALVFISSNSKFMVKIRIQLNAPLSSPSEHYCFPVVYTSLKPLCRPSHEMSLIRPHRCHPVSCLDYLQGTFPHCSGKIHCHCRTTRIWGSFHPYSFWETFCFTEHLKKHQALESLSYVVYYLSSFHFIALLPLL